MIRLRRQKKKVFVGLSGGVDSAVSAALLKRDGYDVTGVFIRISIPDYPCTAGEDKRDAMRVAAHLNIPFLEIDLSKEYQEEVFRASIDEFSAGRTPNPDTLCNREIKFGAFYNFARLHGADFIATGHYAKTRRRKDGRTELVASDDPNKDQSYFLWMVPEEVLTHVIFPVGGMQKPHVRKIAQRFGLPNASRKDSQGLCFLGDISIKDMLQRELDIQPGPVLAENGDVLGTHQGAALYTLGERHGFTLATQSPDATPMFVIATDIDNNTITVSPNRYPTDSTATDLSLVECNWIGAVTPGTCQARFRYRQTLLNATIETMGDESRVVLAEPFHVPLGQSLVLYQGDRCLGGGTVDNSELVLA